MTDSEGRDYLEALSVPWQSAPCRSPAARRTSLRTCARPCMFGRILTPRDIIDEEKSYGRHDCHEET